METIVRINTRTKAARLFLEFVKTLSFAKVEEESHYNPELLRKIKNAEKDIENGDVTRMNPDKIWEGIL